jgi:glucose-1-phosphate thymidylyltransferase
MSDTPMRGIILAGGTGSRLGKSTQVVNKHCLPVYDRPMIEWAAQVMRDNSIEDITIVTGPEAVGPISLIMGDGYRYRVQCKPRGIADALHCAYINDDRPVVVILGDNIFLPSPVLTQLENGIKPTHAHCFLHTSPGHDLTQFGVAVLSDDPPARLVRIVEKPSDPPSKYVVTGLYVFPSLVFELIYDLEESSRGELEITDLLNMYADAHVLTSHVYQGFWGDAGTPQGLLDCSIAAKIWCS